MREETVRSALGSLEQIGAPSDAHSRAHAEMLAAFDSLETAPADGDPLQSNEAGQPAQDRETSGSHGELLELLRDPHQDEGGGEMPIRRLPLVAAAAAIVIALLVGGAAVGGLFDRSDAPELADGAGAIGEDGMEDPVEEEFIDQQLPRRIEGRFTTGVLGGSTSFVVREPLWLVRHETHLVRLVVDPNDPESASLIIARPGVPTEIARDGRMVDFLASNADGVNFQLQPVEVSGVTATFARGRFSGSGCVPGEPCLVLYDSPMQLGLHEGVTNDFVERPMNDGGTVVLMGAIPFADFEMGPFSRPFGSIIDTISFTDTEPNTGSG